MFQLRRGSASVFENASSVDYDITQAYVIRSKIPNVELIHKWLRFSVGEPLPAIVPIKVQEKKSGLISILDPPETSFLEKQLND